MCCQGRRHRATHHPTQLRRCFVALWSRYSFVSCTLVAFFLLLLPARYRNGTDFIRLRSNQTLFTYSHFIEEKNKHVIYSIHIAVITHAEMLYITGHPGEIGTAGFIYIFLRWTLRNGLSGWTRLLACHTRTYIHDVIYLIALGGKMLSKSSCLGSV